MKLRNGFVTNSSSSSFIIQNVKDGLSTQKIYETSCTFYKEFEENVKNLIHFCENDPRFEITRNQEGKVISIRPVKFLSDMWIEISDEIREEFGISMFEFLDRDTSWAKECLTYEEFLAYHKEKEPPFRILDFANPQTEGEYDFESRSSILSWYMLCYEESNTNCEGCRWLSYCTMYQDHPELIPEAMKAKDNINLVLDVFGRFCIFSESGRMPAYVVNKLIEISKFACNHMG